MRYTSFSAIPDRPPPGALAECDAAAQALDLLSRRGFQLTLGLDEQRRTVRVELDDGGGTTVLTPTQLFSLLGTS